MGKIDFCGLALSSAPRRVMTARPATERLVHAALDLIGDQPARVADVGTGSGAIAVALATAAPQAEVWASDISPNAVELARLNIRRHGLEDRVSVRVGDLLDPLDGRFDLVVANLPYLPRASEQFHPDLRDEPSEAVYADGDGLDPYRRLLTAVPTRLAPDGAVVIQLHREVLVAMRSAIPALCASFDPVPAAAA
jgi:release factor glutamine methyltransferase